MTKPFGVTGLWRGVLSVAAVAWCAWACGDDEPAAEVLGPDAGVSLGAGSQGGSGGTASTPVGGAGQSETCEPGVTRACEIDLLCTGVETCAADGQGFGACECGEMGLVGSGSVGSLCESDAECGTGGTCLRADGNVWRGSGGPAGGYCSISCTENADCEAYDSDSYCVLMNQTDGMYCIRRCLSKDPEAGEAKCLNRPDLACVSVVAQGVEVFTADRQAGYCNPRCAVDAECPVGRYCNGNVGRCVDFKNGAATGARCTRDMDCDGTCDSPDAEGVGNCTSQCVLGSLSGCGYGPDVESRDAACLAPYVTVSRFAEGIGDLGLCRELCDVAEDCERFADGFICSPINEGAAAFFGRPGACAPPPEAP